ncbi:MAG: hypothetical protein PVJ84_08000 [Desulfobacteraceae bacterium]|jgi:hypothetical protein
MNKNELIEALKESNGLSKAEARKTVELKLETFNHQNVGQLNTYVSWYRDKRIQGFDMRYGTDSYNIMQ